MKKRSRKSPDTFFEDRALDFLYGSQRSASAPAISTKVGKTCTCSLRTASDGDTVYVTCRTTNPAFQGMREVRTLAFKSKKTGRLSVGSVLREACADLEKRSRKRKR